MNHRLFSHFVASYCLALATTATCLPAAPAADPPKPAAATGGAAASGPAASHPAAPSNTTWAQRKIRVTWTNAPDTSRPDLTTAFNRLLSTDIAGKIGQDVLGIASQEVLTTITHVIDERSPEKIEGNLTIDLDPAKHPKARPAAKEFADRLVDKLSTLLADDRIAEETPRRKDTVQWYQDVVYDYEAKSRQLLDMLNEMGGRSPDGVRAAMSKLDDESQKLELELAGMQARQAAVEDWINRASKQADEQARADQAKGDPVVAELERAVAAQQKMVDLLRKQYESGTVAGTAVPEAEAKLAEARVQLLERKQGADRARGTDSLAALNRELQSLSIDVVDRRARLEFIKKQVEPLQKAANKASRYEALEAERNSLRGELERARQEVRQAERALLAAPRRDRLSVIRSEDGNHEHPAGSAQPE